MADAAEEGFPPTKMQAAPPDAAEGCEEEKQNKPSGHQVGPCSLWSK